jgi:Histone methylation protein DOT1
MWGLKDHVIEFEKGDMLLSKHISELIKDANVVFVINKVFDAQCWALPFSLQKSMADNSLVIQDIKMLLTTHPERWSIGGVTSTIVTLSKQYPQRLLTEYKVL